VPVVDPGFDRKRIRGRVGEIWSGETELSEDFCECGEIGFRVDPSNGRGAEPAIAVERAERYETRLMTAADEGVNDAFHEVKVAAPAEIVQQDRALPSILFRRPRLAVARWCRIFRESAQHRVHSVGGRFLGFTEGGG
jgi:hypothetical protein